MAKFFGIFIGSSAAMFYFILVVFIVVSWPKNIYELTKCDFSPDTSFKCEATHIIGILPPAALVTAWINTEGEPNE